MNNDLISYYKDRAKEYDRIYAKPERQESLQHASALLQDLFAHKTVLEIACGTGYWTQKIAETATSVLATDINESVLDIARSKPYPEGRVRFGLADLFDFQPETPFDALFGGFIWSHILLQDLDPFLARVGSFVQPGGLVVFMDNRFVAGSSLPVTKTDDSGNSYQTRVLDNGTSHLVLKNFPTKDFLCHKLGGFATELEVLELPYYWILRYNTGQRAV